MTPEQQIAQIETVVLPILKYKAAGNPVEWEIRKLVPQALDGRLQEGPTAWLKATASNDPVSALKHGHEIRIKPWKLGPTINGHTLGHGQEWHHTDFTREDLPAGMRPHILGELTQEGDEVLFSSGWEATRSINSVGSRNVDIKRRTTRPLPAGEWVANPPAFRSRHLLQTRKTINLT
jgi:hypothetical protein